MTVEHPMRAYARAVQRICLEPEIPDDALAEAGGDARRWRQYRAMVRSRLRRAVREGLPRSVEALGAERFGKAHARFLTAHGTRSRLFRDVAGEFAAFALSDDELELSGLERDLLLWEAAMAHARDALDPPTCAPFDFETPPVIAPSARLLTVDHAVWDVEAPMALDAPAQVVIWRRPADLGVRWWRLHAVEAAWFAAWSVSESRSAMDRAVASAQAHGVAIDESFVDTIASFAAAAIERGVVTGSMTVA